MLDYSHYMKLALEAARQAEFQTEPNPMVGAVLVDLDGTVLSTGYHEKAGMPHAEVNTLQAFEAVPEGSTLFVTLEPCCHHGKTPPCTELLIQKKVKKVVVGTVDPNLQVAGKGIQQLRDHGCDVITGVCQQEAYDLNRIFNTHILKKRPYVVAKAAISLDGKIAMPSGESQWITGTEARSFGHRLRSRYQAIAIGKNTLLQDNPQLTDRTSEVPRQPIPVLFSSQGHIPETSHFYQDPHRRRIIFAGNAFDSLQIPKFSKANIQSFIAKESTPPLDWALTQLYNEGICSMLIEGGGQLISSFLKAELVDELYLFMAGKIIGAASAPSWCGELGIQSLGDVPQGVLKSATPLGPDMLLNIWF